MLKSIRALGGWILLAAALGRAEGTVSGTILDPATNGPVEHVAVTLQQPDGTVVQRTVTDARGQFALEMVAPGTYDLGYAQADGAAGGTRRVTLDRPGTTLALGLLPLAREVVQLEAVEVKAGAATFLNSIDRKVYIVGREIQSVTGTASDLLQNIPSVEVDLEGNVSLRGSESVTILVNGRRSALMGRNRAAALQQLPADAIEKIEVITNPSAKYKPDGTGGIINIELKKKTNLGYAGTVNVAAGNEDRYNASFSGNYNPGRYNLHGSFSVRQDDRARQATEFRTSVASGADAITRRERHTVERSRPFTQMAQAGIDFTPGGNHTAGVALDFQRRRSAQQDRELNVVRDGRGDVTSRYERTGDSPESERSAEFTATYQLRFPQEAHALDVEFNVASEVEDEDNLFTNSFQSPVPGMTFDRTRNEVRERETEAAVEYTRPIDGESKLEAGYTWEETRLDTAFAVAALDPTSGRWVADAAKSNRFRYDETIHAFYATYGRTFGKLGVLAGLRPEFATVRSHLPDTGETFPNDYARIYPSLHLARKLNEEHELQWNYSHRIERPDSDELNPFPQYSDPFNLQAGNPNLVPENVHSFEAGYGFNRGDTTVTATVYHRALSNGFTSITRDIGGGVLLTTEENLAESRSTGFELTANAELGERLALSFSSNAYRDTIDASNLGLGANRSAVSWTAKLGASVQLPRDTLLQFNANYRSSRLSAQGSREPSYVANMGLRRDFMQKKAALVLTVSDLFNSLKETNRIDTPALQRETVRRRSARIVYVGIIYRFGKASKRSEDDGMQFDETL